MRLAQLILFVTGGLFFLESCQRELSCEGCRDNNRPPVAVAGADQRLRLPVDSVLLDGTASSDPDGKIIEWRWRKLSGPASFGIISPASEKTVVKSLIAGIYLFELKVADDKGLSATDTVQVLVDDPGVNQPPVANAGNDTTIKMPASTATLDGSRSVDPDGNIASYTWTKIAGPSSATIANASVVITQVSNLVEGVYEFELKVTDAGALFSKDTVKVTVTGLTSIVDCYGNVRPRVDAGLKQLGSLSIARQGIAVAAAGGKILFAGGISGSYSGSVQVYSRVDIYDVASNQWSTAELSEARTGMGVAVLNNRVYFGGGEKVGSFSSRVDIYDATTNSWTKAELSGRRSHSAGAAAGTKVLFAGGMGTNDSAPPVDIYDVVTLTWTVDSLRNRNTKTIIGDAGIAATTIGNKIYFAGNASDWFGWDFGSITSTINIYDAVSNTWSLSDLSIPRGFMASIAVNNKIFWAGGVNDQSNNYTNLVEIRDVNSGSSSYSCLSSPNAFFSAVKKDNKIVFFTLAPNMLVQWPNTIWRREFDIYDISTNSWAIGVLPVSMGSTQIISVDNVIYLAGGIVDGSLSDKVWKLEF